MPEPRSPADNPADADLSREALLAELGRVRAERDALREVTGRWQSMGAAAVRSPVEAHGTQLSILLAAARALGEATSLDVLARRIVEALAVSGGWDAGLLWLVDDATDTLRVAAGWGAPEAHAGDFLAASRAYTFARGDGLPGRTWALGEASWVLNVLEEPHYPRAGHAARAGLHGAMAFPVRAGDRVLGVIELYTRDLRPPAPEQTQVGAVLNSLIGQFIDRERAEAAVRESNERLAAEAARQSAILDSALDAIVTMDDAGRVTEFNPAAERLFGYTRAEALGQDMGELIVPPALREAHRRGLARYLASGEGHILGRRLEMPALRRDGSEFPVELTITRIPRPGPAAFTGTMRDITERREAEAQRRELAALKQSDQLKDQFLSILSHELRTPINAIMGFGSILGDELAGSLTERQHEYVRKLLSGADVLLALVDDLLDMSRIQAGKFSLSPQPVALAPLIEEVTTTLAPLAVQRGQAVVCLVMPELPELVADRQRVVQVLTNLVGNAIKFTPEGGRVTVRACLAGEACEGVRVEVADTGPGISAADRPKLFRRFTQLDMSATRQAGGTGLGLSIAKALVEAHGGTIGVESEPGHGATFWFTLPLDGPPESGGAHSEGAADRV